ncbi:hypothetical protein BC835DRAFT_632472 [Cytidiella melzeri]|nr:hypothetical protein BC835DRAFT_632472 [Cytidiella melzeri]
MHSFVARLRGRAVSQTTTVSSHSETLPDTPDTPTFTHSLHDFSDAHTPVISRRILPQVHELLESYSTEDHLPDTHPADELQSGLSPRPVKHNIRPSSVSSNVDASNERSESRSASPSTSVNIGKGSFARISRRLATTPWSTFGRTTTPKVSQLDHAPTSKRFHFGSVDTFAAPRASQSSTSLANYAAGSSVSHNRSRRPSHTSEGSSWKNESSHRRSPSLSTIVQDLHSSSPPGTSSGITSVKGPSPTHSSPSSKSQVFSAHTHVLSNLNMHSGSSSHQTFGPTSTSIHPSAFVTPTTTPIPEVDTNASLPNLASPLQAILCDKSNETTDPPPLRHWTSSLHAKTFPMRQRSKTVSSGKPDENTVPFPASGRRLRSYTSAPAVRHIFLQRPPSTPKLGGRRPSTKSSRRSSADWSAQQATAGVAFNAVGEYGWPAQVSREIIRMSLGDLDAPQLRHSATGKRHDRQSANADITKRGHNVPHASEVAGRPCTSLPSPNSLPHNTEGMLAIDPLPSGLRLRKHVFRRTRKRRQVIVALRRSRR